LSDVTEIIDVETMAQQTGNFNATEKRQSLFGQLDYAVGLAREKAEKEKASNDTRQRWLRILISAVETYGRLLETSQLDDLAERITKLETAASK